MSPLFALAIKVIGLTAIAAILFTTNVVLGTPQEEDQLAASNGGLTVALDAPSYTKGDRVTVSGSVEDSNEGSTVWINVEDPLGKQVEGYIVDVNTNDNTFSQSWMAGIQEHNPITEPTYDREGVYRVTVSYLTPDFQNEEVILTFDYSNAPPVPTAPPIPPPVSTPPVQQAPPPTTISQPLNVTALRSLVAQGQEQFQQLSTTLTQGNVSDGVLANLNSIQSTFQEIRGHLNGVAEGTQVIQ